MNWIDILILLIFLASTIMGIWRGFIHETLSLLAWIAAFIIARIFAPDVAHWLEQSIESQALILLLSWIIPFTGTFIIFNLIKILLISFITIVGLRPFDRMLGAVFGAVKGALLVTAGVLVIQLVLSRSGDAFKTESRLVPHFQIIALWMLKTLDQETELSLDNVVGRFSKMIDSGSANINLDAWQNELGLSVNEISAILKDEQKLTQLKAIINDPEAMDKLKESITSDKCKKENCGK